jgi:hypothetical protein
MVGEWIVDSWHDYLHQAKNPFIVLVDQDRKKPIQILRK